MSRHFVCTSVALALLLVACMNSFYAGDLNALSLGVSKQEFVQRYTRSQIYPPIARASKIVSADTIDVMTLSVQDRDHRATDYWFVFRNSRLVQWGKPEDWKNVSATYQIDFNPVPGTRTP